MSGFIDTFWQMRLEKCKTALEKNKFDAFVAGTGSEAVPGLTIPAVTTTIKSAVTSLRWCGFMAMPG